jgi:CBS domain-containing protein
MRVKEIMHGPTFVSPETLVCDAAKIMKEKNISSVIVGTAEKPIGMFTERDIARKVAANGLDCSVTRVKDTMSTKVETVSEDSPVEEAITRMMTHYVRHMPVVDKKGKIVGMISARTVMDALRYHYF